MLNEKILSWFVKINFVFLLFGFWVMIFVFMFSFGNGQSLLNPGLIQCYGYVIALVFGGIALKKRVFIVLSLVGWVVFFFGYSIEQKEVREAHIKQCLEQRQDPFCIEESNGTMNCSQGAKVPGVFPRACEELLP